MARGCGLWGGATALLLLVLAACRGSASPTTSTTITSEPATTVDTIGEVITTTSTTLDRLAEVEAILQDLEERRLDALYRKDLEALREIHASDGLYRTVAEEVIPSITFLEAPTEVIVDVEEILVDRNDCLALDAIVDVTQSLGPAAASQKIIVLQPTKGGIWGYAYVGTGWLCEGPSPHDL